MGSTATRLQVILYINLIILIDVHTPSFYKTQVKELKCTPNSDHARMHPLLNWCATVGTVLHPLRADVAHALVAARHGEVRLRMGHTHDARSLAADGGLRNGDAASDVAGIGERQHWLS